MFALPVLMAAKDSFSTGSIKVLNTDEWCGRPGIPDFPAICSIRGDSTALFNDNHGAVPQGAPYTQILEIDGADAIYVVKRTGLDGGLSFPAGAKAQFAVDGKHLLIKFDREVKDRHGEVHVQHGQDKTDILQVKKP
jgi:hypothetical protein